MQVRAIANIMNSKIFILPYNVVGCIRRIRLSRASRKTTSCLKEHCVLPKLLWRVGTILSSAPLVEGPGSYQSGTCSIDTYPDSTVRSWQSENLSSREDESIGWGRTCKRVFLRSPTSWTNEAHFMEEYLRRKVCCRKSVFIGAIACCCTRVSVQQWFVAGNI